MSKITVITQRTAICRLGPDDEIPSWVQDSELNAIVRTPDELSIVCDERSVPGSIKVDKGWRILKVAGPLDFSQVGVLAAILRPLAQAGVSIFTISTFDTDYILVKEENLELAVNILISSGHIIEDT